MYYVPPDNREISTVTRETLDQCSKLLAQNILLDCSEDAPMLWSVWAQIKNENGEDDEELIGAGPSPDEAAEEALAQAREWAEE